MRYSVEILDCDQKWTVIDTFSTYIDADRAKQQLEAFDPTGYYRIFDNHE